MPFTRAEIDKNLDDLPRPSSSCARPASRIVKVDISSLSSMVSSRMTLVDFRNTPAKEVER